MRIEIRLSRFFYLIFYFAKHYNAKSELGVMEFKIDYIIDDIKDFIELCITNGEIHTGKTTTEFAERKKLSHVISNLHASYQTIIFTKLKEPERKTFVQEFTSALHEDIILFLETNLLYEFLNIIGSSCF